MNVGRVFIETHPLFDVSAIVQLQWYQILYNLLLLLHIRSGSIVSFYLSSCVIIESRLARERSHHIHMRYNNCWIFTYFNNKKSQLIPGNNNKCTAKKTIVAMLLIHGISMTITIFYSYWDFFFFCISDTQSQNAKDYRTDLRTLKKYVAPLQFNKRKH